MAEAECFGNLPQGPAGQVQPAHGGVVLRSRDDGLPLGLAQALALRARLLQEGFVQGDDVTSLRLVCVDIIV
jgi:hypothetical protein